MTRHQIRQKANYWVYEDMKLKYKNQMYNHSVRKGGNQTKKQHLWIMYVAISSLAINQKTVFTLIPELMNSWLWWSQKVQKAMK